MQESSRGDQEALSWSNIQTVDWKIIACCIKCVLANKQKGKQEGYLHWSPKN